MVLVVNPLADVVVVVVVSFSHAHEISASYHPFVRLETMGR